MRLNDLQKDLETKLYVKTKFWNNKLVIDNLKTDSFLRDLSKWKKNIDVSWKKHIGIKNNKLIKNKKVFDSIVETKKIKDLDLRYIDVINNALKPSKKKNNKNNKEIKKEIINEEISNKHNKTDLKQPKHKEVINDKKKLKNKLFLIIKNFFRFSSIKNLFLKIGILFFMFCIVLYIDKLVVVNYINSWYKKLISIKENPTDIVYVKKILNDAKFDFLIWNTLFKPFLLLNNESVRNWYNVISWWTEITKLWDNLVNIIYLTKKFISNKWIENIYLTNLLSNLRNDFLMTEYWLEKALSHYKKIDSLWDIELDKKLSDNLDRLIFLKDYVYLINSNFDTVLNILWHNNEKKYLIVFQNSDEIRPTWWFMGSMGILTLFRWKVKSFEKKDVYEFEWDLKKADYSRLKAPKWIIELTDRFWLRDSNYFVNLKDSSENIKFFMDKSGNDIDWIVYLNQNILLDFLEETWWIKVEWINEEITNKNFSEVMSILVEAKLFKKWTLWTPKQILFDFMEVFFTKLKNDKEYSTYWKILLDNFNKREILLYSFIPEENKIFETLWLWWKINYKDSLDFSYPVYTSLSWNKSDRYRQVKYYKDIIINDDCSIDTTLTVSSTHFFPNTKEDEISEMFDNYNITKTKSLIDIQWRWDNYQFIRIILPKSAIIEDAEKYHVQELNEKKSIEFFMRTKRLETKNEEITYKIMNNICEKYSFILYKQPWIKSYDMSFSNDWVISENYWIKEDLYYNTNNK